MKYVLLAQFFVAISLREDAGFDSKTGFSFGMRRKDVSDAERAEWEEPNINAWTRTKWREWKASVSFYPKETKSNDTQGSDDESESKTPRGILKKPKYIVDGESSTTRERFK